MNILVTGANGFIGNALIGELLENGHNVYALVRSEDHPKDKTKKIQWLHGDLLKPEILPDLPKIDKAFYLVHGLKEDDASFEYFESLAAVNFVNWIRPTSAKIIYLGGLGSDESKSSPHLRSRHLTGAILGSSGLGLFEFRASIVLGEGSISFEMIKAISERVPFRPELSLLDSPCQPIALSDLLKYFEAAIEMEIKGHQIFEIGGADTATYGQLLDMYAELANLKRKKFKVPEIETKVILKVLDYTIPELASVGKKLTKSLGLPTVVTNDDARIAFPDIHPKSLRMAMDMTMAVSKTHYRHLWEKQYLKNLLSDKILTQSGLFSPDLLKNLEKFTKFKDILTRKS